MAERAPKIKVRRYRVRLEPEIELFHVTVERGDGVWEETWGSRELLDAFIRGVQAGGEGYPDYPEIPSQAEELPESRVTTSDADDDIPF